jgi:hypothetical protein
MAGSNTCGGADSSLPEDFLEEIRQLIKAQHTAGTMGWEQHDHLDLIIKKKFKRDRTHLDDHDCCLAEDIGRPRCKDGECCCGSLIYYDDASPNPHRKPHRKL